MCVLNTLYFNVILPIYKIRHLHQLDILKNFLQFCLTGCKLQHSIVFKKIYIFYKFLILYRDLLKKKFKKANSPEIASQVLFYA